MSCRRRHGPVWCDHDDYSSYPEYPARGHPVAEHYGAEPMEFPGLSHFQLVVDQRVRDAVAQWVSSVSPG